MPTARITDPTPQTDENVSPRKWCDCDFGYPYAEEDCPHGRVESFLADLTLPQSMHHQAGQRDRLLDLIREES